MASQDPEIERVPEGRGSARSPSISSSAHNEIFEEAEELLEEVRSVTVNVGKIVSEEVKEGLEQLATPEAQSEFGAGDVVAAVVTVVAFNCDMLSDVLLARQLYLGDDLDKRWAFATLCMTVLPLIIVNGFSFYWYWFDSLPPDDVNASPSLFQDHSQKFENGLPQDMISRSKNSEKTICSTEQDEHHEIERNFHRELQVSKECVGNVEIYERSKLSPKVNLDEPNKTTEERIKSYTQINCDAKDMNFSVAKFVSNEAKQHLPNNAEGSCNSNFKMRVAQHKPNRIKRALIWILRMLFHLTLQASSLRQLDLLYYGTLSVSGEKKERANGEEYSALRDSGLRGAHHKKLDRPNVLRSYEGRPHESEVKINSSGRRVFESPKFDVLLTENHVSQGREPEKNDLSEDCVDERQRYKQLWLHAESDGAALDLIGAVLQDIPQIILQLYLLALSVPLLSSSVLRYSSYFNGFQIDSWLFAAILDRMELGNSSTVISKNNTGDNLTNGNFIGSLNFIQRNFTTELKLTSANETLGSVVTTNYLRMNLEFLPTMTDVNDTSQAEVLGLVAPEELLPETENHLVTLQLACLCGSLCAVSWSASSWVRSVRLASPRLPSLSPASLLILTLAHLTAILPQVVCYTALAAASASLLVLVLLLLWAAYTTWILTQLYRWSLRRRQLLEWFPHDVRTGWCRRADDVCVSAALALVFLLTFLDVSGDEAPLQAALHALLRLALQTAVAAMWWVSTGGVAWLQRGPLIFVVSAGVLHAVLTAAYYSLLQRANVALTAAAAAAKGAEESVPKAIDDCSCVNMTGIDVAERPPDTSRTQVVSLQDSI